MRELDVLLLLIDEAYDKKAWHGSGLRGSVRRVKFDQAVWRPADDRKNVWEIMLHAAYWKYAVRRRIMGEKRGSFAYQGSNWFARDAACSPQQWRQDVQLLDASHAALRDAVSRLKPSRLTEVPAGAKVDMAEVIRGIALHDVYHAGQIQTLKRQWQSSQR